MEQIEPHSLKISRKRRGIAIHFLSRRHIEEEVTKTGKVAKGKRTNVQYKQYQIT